MVFLGDSITEQRMYTRYVMDYFALRYPDADIRFRNAGWSGEKADGGLRRLERDVLAAKPTVVSVCYGMNDGDYGPFQEALYTNYIANLGGIVTRLKAAGVRVVLLTPGCVDPDQIFRWRLFDGREYNLTLARYAAGVRELAVREGVPVCDLHALMLDIQTRAKKDDPKFTMIPDKIHPDAGGSAVIAYGLLKLLGGEAPSSLALDAATGAFRADRCTVTNLAIADGEVSFVRRDAALPTYLDPAAQPILKYLPFEEEVNRYTLIVTNLPAGTWQLKVEGLLVGAYTSEALAAGVNLGMQPGPWMKLGADVNKLVLEYEDASYLRWRQLELPFSWLQFRLPELKADAQGLLAKIDTLIEAREAARRTVASQRNWRWELRKTAAVAQ